MLHTKLTAVFRRLRRWAAEDAAPPVLPTADQIRTILERERERADRTGAPLSVATFAAREPADQIATQVWLAKILQGRLRTLDAFGWLDERRLCAVLPATPIRGAWKVVDDVCRNFPVTISPPLCEVYSYPDEPVNRASAEATVEAVKQGASEEVTPLHPLLVKPLPRWKRFLDVLGAAAGLIVLSPVLLLVALAIKVFSPGPVVFSQWRTGRGGQPFLLYKFRTMVPDAEVRKAQLLECNERDGPAFKMKNDPRVTPLGRLLRTTSLDELPQLWNVLKGDMSLVGPRPLPCKESDGCAPWQRRRLDVMPGLTCIWQVRGRGTASFADWIRMDVEYIRSHSPWQDMKLILLTVPAVVLRRGAH